jgi:hypothetical protein
MPRTHDEALVEQARALASQGKTQVEVPAELPGQDAGASPGGRGCAFVSQACRLLGVDESFAEDCSSCSGMPRPVPVKHQLAADTVAPRVADFKPAGRCRDPAVEGSAPSPPRQENPQPEGSGSVPVYPAA